MARYCENCNQDMGWEVTRRRRFCSDKCRVAFNRAHKANESYSIAMNAIYRLGKAPTAHKQEAVDSLRQLKKAIDDALRTLGDRETLDKFSMLQSISSGIKPFKSEYWECRECGQKAFIDPKDKPCPFCKAVAWEHPEKLST